MSYEEKIKAQLEETGYDYKQFLQDLEKGTISGVQKTYGVPYSAVIYLKGKYNFPLTNWIAGKMPRSVFDISEPHSVTVPKAWRDFCGSTEVIREKLYERLVQEGMAIGTGKR